MKKNTQIVNIKVLMALCIMLLFACKKNSDDIVYSQREPSQNLFLSLSGTGNLNRTQTVSLLSTSNTGNTGVALNLTQTTSTDINATVSVDTSKVKAYNAINNTQFRLLAANNYDIKVPTGGLTIKAGSLYSTDSLKINFKNLTGLRASNYLLPVTITKVSGSSSVILSDSVKTVYINVSLTDVKQSSVSINLTSGTSKALSYPYGATGAATTLPVTVKLDRVSPNNLTVSAGVNNSLVSSYNTSTGNNFLQFPDGSYTVSPGTVLITAGQLNATSPINVNIPDLSKFDNTKTYLLPVSISKISDDYVLLGNSVIYVKLSFDIRARWSVSATASFDGTPYGGSNYLPNNAIDGDNGTDWIAAFQGSATQYSSFIIDMKSASTIKTISYKKSYSSILVNYGVSAYPDFVNIYTSNDGSTWTFQLKYMPAQDTGGSVSNPVINNIQLSSPVSARFVRLEVAYYKGFSEVNVY